MRKVLTTFVLAWMFAAGPAVGAARSLGIAAPNGEETIAYDMNALGQVIAVLQDEDGNQRGVMFDKGRLIELGSLGGNFSDAKGINDNGLIVGSARKRDGSWSAFLFDREGGMHVLGTLGGPSSYGMALNQQGRAVGFADTDNGDWHAFLYDGSPELKDLGTLGGKISYAADINNRGQVVGTAQLENGYRRAFLYEHGRGMLDLGTLGGRISSATAINDDGVIVGASETKDRRWHAFVHDGERMIDLGAIIGWGNSFATGINSAGHVVGTLVRGRERMSFVWRDNKMTLHHGGVGLNLTNTINDKGLVIGATYNRRYDAAVMRSNAVPILDRGGSAKILTAIAIVLTLAIAAVIVRRRYRGIELPHTAA